MSGLLLDPATVDARRLLVVAPHPDDESLGCGGLIALLAGRGTAVHVVFVTDGSGSHPRSPTWPRDRLARQREGEAREAISRLGVAGDSCTFLGLSDAAMPALDTVEGESALIAFTRIVADFRPDLALLPWRRDPHCDHRDSWTLATGAIREAGTDTAILEYAVWLDELGSEEDRPRAGEVERLVFDVGAARQAKRAAVFAHLSQTTDLIDDDPDGFRLTAETVDRLTGAHETFWR